METYSGCFSLRGILTEESVFFIKKVLCKGVSYSMIFEVYDCIRLSNIHRRKRIPDEDGRERYGRK